LSQLFTRYAGQGFVEFINQSKIAAAKELFGRRDARVYEIAEQLGFESAFYFSKVFKKIEGISPRDYIRKLESSGDNPIDGGK
ncbi:helix-turn-helix transcriptional regulator, partial [Treponema sp. OttesenSCG-928-L16]|nr:helix-turn-helix transcriptional regulator [Treponema sp. OttesenSCG-928-L16]